MTIFVTMSGIMMKMKAISSISTLNLYASHFIFLLVMIHKLKKAQILLRFQTQLFWTRHLFRSELGATLECS